MRWDNLRSGSDGDGRLPGLEEGGVRVRTFDAPEALDIHFHEVEARSAINSVPPMARVGFRHTVNPYRGCTHGCVQCFARPTHTYLGFNAREDFRREIVVKVNLPEVLRAELRRASWKGELIALGTNTDPYQWVEGRYRITRGIFEELLAARNPCSVLTRSPLLLRDLDLFSELAAGPGFSASLSVPTLDERTWRATEPATPHPRKRIEAIARLSEAGIETGVLIAPLMPGVNDDPGRVAEIARLCGEAGARRISGLGLHLRGELREIFFDWLREYRPDLLPRYERLYEGRSGYLPNAERKRLAALVRGPGSRPGRRRPGSDQVRTSLVDPTPERDAAPESIPQRLF